MRLDDPPNLVGIKSCVSVENDVKGLSSKRQARSSLLTLLTRPGHVIGAPERHHEVHAERLKRRLGGDDAALFSYLASAKLAKTPPSPVPMSSADSASARIARAVASYDQSGLSAR